MSVENGSARTLAELDFDIPAEGRENPRAAGQRKLQHAPGIAHEGGDPGALPSRPGVLVLAQDPAGALRRRPGRQRQVGGAGELGQARVAEASLLQPRRAQLPVAREPDEVEPDAIHRELPRQLAQLRQLLLAVGGLVGTEPQVPLLRRQPLPPLPLPPPLGAEPVLG